MVISLSLSTRSVALIGATCHIVASRFSGSFISPFSLRTGGRQRNFQARRSLFTSPREVNSMERLHSTVARAHRYLNDGDDAASVIGEASGGGVKRRKKLKCWQVIPVCLQSNSTSKVPTKGVLTQLCKKRLGSKWFCSNDKLSIETDLTENELHFLLLCLYPQLQGIPYEFCKATGPGNKVLFSLTIEDQRRRPRRETRFVPYFTCAKLKEQIGRKGKLYIRPLQNIPDAVCTTITELEVYNYMLAF